MFWKLFLKFIEHTLLLRPIIGVYRKFQLVNLHLWQAEHCTLHSARCTLPTAPGPTNAPEYEHLLFILHIEHCTLHTTCLYLIFQIYHFTLQISKICACCCLDLHGEMFLDMVKGYIKFGSSPVKVLISEGHYIPYVVCNTFVICFLYLVFGEGLLNVVPLSPKSVYLHSTVLHCSCCISAICMNLVLSLARHKTLNSFSLAFLVILGTCPTYPSEQHFFLIGKWKKS